MKKIYQSPCAQAYRITSKTFISQSMKVDGTEKVSNSADIGFVKDQNSQNDKNVWDEEW